jgi:S-DNA-T family DNA segregation ATPase FtsK/SpoIIIE
LASLAEAPEPSAMPPQRAARAASRRSQGQLEEAARASRIVDTKPQQEVERVARAERTVRRHDPFELPSPELLAPASVVVTPIDKERILAHATQLEKTLADYGVSARVVEIHPGPTVTTYEVAPEAGTKVSKVAALADDLALGLSRTVRIIAPIPGKSRIGFELPNDEHAVNASWSNQIRQARGKAPLQIVLGRDIMGAPFLRRSGVPQKIVVGATGASRASV